jgi:hybrid cluster-associated redox disulfide protein
MIMHHRRPPPGGAPAPAGSGPADDPDLMLDRLFALCPQAAAPFLARRMLCPGCPIAPFHTVGDACAEYGLEEAAFRAQLRRAVEESRRGPGPRRAGGRER